MIKLDLGAGDVSPPGYLPMGRAHGTEIFPLAYEDGSVDEIRASHVLEHFPFAEVPKVLQHWSAKLKPGGVLKIAVPDFAKITKAYQDGVEAPIEGYTVGGQTDENDFHRSLFDERTLADYFHDAGLTDIGPWDSDCEDCSRLPISLNLRAVKPVPMVPGSFKVLAIMSMPAWGSPTISCARIPRSQRWGSRFDHLSGLSGANVWNAALICRSPKASTVS
jgi:SAM-dependent methyltransferase